MTLPDGFAHWVPAIKREALIRGIDWQLCAALVWTESSFKPWAFRHEPGFWRRYMAGRAEWERGMVGDDLDGWKWRASSSYGLCQIMFPTAVYLKALAAHDSPERLFLPDLNLATGIGLLAANIDKAGSVRGGLLRYNGGGDAQYPDRVLSKLREIDNHYGGER